jgi:hypothetical protein
MDNHELNINLADHGYDMRGIQANYSDEVINDEIDAENAQKKKDVRAALERMLEAKRMKEDTDFI